MKAEIYSYIKNNKNNHFHNIWNQFSNHEKTEVGQIIRELEKEKKIIKIDNEYYDLELFPAIQGYVQWGLNGNAFLSEEDKTNQFGIAFSEENLGSIFNKKEAFLGHFAKGKKITLENREFIYLMESVQRKKIEYLAVYQENKNEFIILNNGLNQKIEVNHQVKKYSNNDIVKINTEKEIVEKIGNIEEKGIETIIVSQLSNLKETPFLNKIDPIQEDKISNIPFLTIDGKETKDIDDALWMEKKENGFILYVAIADVSEYIKEEMPQDEYAKQLSSSFYLPHKTYHMFPKELAENIFSLNPKSIKKAMICEIHLDNQYSIQSHKFYHKNIQSIARLTYNDVDKLLENMEGNESYILNEKNELENIEKISKEDKNYQKIKKSIELLAELGIVKSQEKESKKYDNIEFSFNENGKIDSLYIEERNSISQKIVEQSMLMANRVAAEDIYKNYPNIGIFRNQTKPIEEENIKPAFYHQNNDGHWGLQAEFYTHFTSPIRRYCDIVIHRLLKEIQENKVRSYDQDKLDIIVKQINTQQYKAKQINLRVRQLLLNQYMEKLINENKFSKRMKIYDISNQGIYVRNKENIDLFIPTFKLSRDINDDLNNIGFSKLSQEEKEIVIKKMNQNYKVMLYVDHFHWLDDKKSFTYKVFNNKSENENKPLKVKM
jgi:ribonuclease R